MNIPTIINGLTPGDSLVKETPGALRWRNGVLQQRWWVETVTYGPEVTAHEDWRDVPAVTE